MDGARVTERRRLYNNVRRLVRRRLVAFVLQRSCFWSLGGGVSKLGKYILFLKCLSVPDANEAVCEVMVQFIFDRTANVLEGCIGVSPDITVCG